MREYCLKISCCNPCPAFLELDVAADGFSEECRSLVFCRGVDKIILWRDLSESGNNVKTPDLCPLPKVDEDD